MLGPPSFATVSTRKNVCHWPTSQQQVTIQHGDGIDGGAIGRRYRRQDEAGTPFGITIDFGTLGEPMEQGKRAWFGRGGS